MTHPDDSPLGHEGEQEMRRRFPGPYHWDAQNLPLMLRPQITASLARFIEAQPFFFIATASAGGHCDASFRGRNYRADGQPLPALKVLGPAALAFPDYTGNGLYNSLGNILVNPQIGMLFMDFAQQRRARVNGRAVITQPDAVMDGALADLWPQAQAVVLVEVQQAYGNCAARIPRMVMQEGSDCPLS